jgi:hypothetical protein
LAGEEQAGVVSGDGVVSLASLLSQTVSIQNMTEGSEDGMGNAELAASGAPVTTNGLIQQTSTQEVTIGRDTAVSDWVLYLGAGESIGYQDLVSEGGRTFEVVGDPYRVRSPLGEHHLQVRLRQVT